MVRKRKPVRRSNASNPLVPGDPPHYVMGGMGTPMVWAYQGREIWTYPGKSGDYWMARWADPEQGGKEVAASGRDEHEALANARYKIDIYTKVVQFSDYRAAAELVDSVMHWMNDHTDEKPTRANVARRVHKLGSLVAPENVEAFDQLPLPERMKLIDEVVGYQIRSNLWEPERLPNPYAPKRTAAQVRKAAKKRLAEGKRLAKHRGVPLHVGRAAYRELFRRHGLAGSPSLEDMAFLGYDDSPSAPLTAVLQRRGPAVFGREVLGGEESYWVPDVEESVEAWREKRARRHFVTKAGLRSDNPGGKAVSDQPLPVIKRGMVPEMILGTFGRKAVFLYRGWEIEVLQNIPDYWDVNIEPPVGDKGVYMSSRTFEGAVCLGKIIVDFKKAVDAANAGGRYDGLRLTQVWAGIGHAAQDIAAEEKVLPTRSMVSRAIQGARRRAPTGPSQWAWYDSLPLKLRVSLIDDKLEQVFCSYGTDLYYWP